jgi:hypothetical protein
MGGRLFKGLQQGIEGGSREHVDFVDDVDFIAAVGWHVPDIVSEIADLIHTVVGGTVNFKDIHRLTRGDFQARTAGIAGRCAWALLAIHGFGQNSGNGGFAGSPGAGEQNGMGYPSGGYGMAEGLRDMILFDDIRKCLRSVFTGKNQIRHIIFPAETLSEGAADCAFTPHDRDHDRYWEWI